MEFFKEKIEGEFEVKKEKKLIAKKDFKIVFGKDIYEIKEGEEINVPKMFHANLKTENVI